MSSNESKSKSKRKTREQREEEQLNSIRAKGIFNQARKGEMFGKHPGYVDVRIRISVYNPVTKRAENLPEKGFDVLASTIEEVDDMLRLMEERIKRWIAGY